jgi:hypothetical protein
MAGLGLHLGRYRSNSGLPRALRHTVSQPTIYAGLWCKRQDLARYDVGRAAGGVGMSELMGVEQLFEGRHFDREVIILCVRWYLRFKLSLRDLVKMMAERGLSLAHTTIMRWVWRYAPEFEKRWKRFAQAVGRSWRWTRHTSKFEANGAISIVPWIGRGGRLTLG